MICLSILLSHFATLNMGCNTKILAMSLRFITKIKFLYHLYQKLFFPSSDFILKLSLGFVSFSLKKQLHSKQRPHINV